MYIYSPICCRSAGVSQAPTAGIRPDTAFFSAHTCTHKMSLSKKFSHNDLIKIGVQKKQIQHGRFRIFKLKATLETEFNVSLALI